MKNKYPIRNNPMYIIESSGKVWSKKTCKYLSPWIDNTGYKTISLCDQGSHKNVSIHRMLAIHFISNPKKYPCVNHIDGNKLNNKLSNLEWCTHKQNTNHAIKIGIFKPCFPKGENSGRSKLNNKDVKEILYLNLYFSQTQIAEFYNVHQCTVSRICRNLIWRNI